MTVFSFLQFKLLNQVTCEPHGATGNYNAD